jgi:hypothetical protein
MLIQAPQPPRYLNRLCLQQDCNRPSQHAYHQLPVFKSLRPDVSRMWLLYSNRFETSLNSLLRYCSIRENFLCYLSSPSQPPQPRCLGCVASIASSTCTLPQPRHCLDRVASTPCSAPTSTTTYWHHVNHLFKHLKHHVASTTPALPPYSSTCVAMSMSI